MFRSCLLLFLFAMRLVATQSNFLSDWFMYMLPVLGNQTMLDVALPGTHDSMTFDLSNTVADGYFVLTCFNL